MANKRGSMLIMTYLVLIALIVFGAALGLLATTETRIAERQRRRIVAFQNAEAGLERALYDLRQDFIGDSSSPGWNDADIHGFAIGPDTASFYTIPYATASLNGGSYTVRLKNEVGAGDGIWIRSTGTLGDVSQTVQLYAKIVNISPWNNAIFAGAGAAGAMINGNVHIRGSVHILGTNVASTDYVVDLGGTADLIGNNYGSLDAALQAKIPALPTTVFNGETVSTLNAELRVKNGIVALSGAATAGEEDVSGNSIKETIDGSYVTHGFGGTAGTGNVYSDNGWSNTYDMGDDVPFPSLSNPYPGYATYQAYLKANAKVISDPADLAVLANVTPSSTFTYSDAKGTLSMDGSGNMTVDGIVYIDGGNLNMSGSTITYTGKGSVVVTGDAAINVNLITSGNNSFPTNILGIMTPQQISFGTAQIDVMGVFYAEEQITSTKQTDVVGTFVSNYFDMGTNVPKIYQVPDVLNNLPPGMINNDGVWLMRTASWQKL